MDATGNSHENAARQICQMIGMVMKTGITWPCTYISNWFLGKHWKHQCNQKIQSTCWKVDYHAVSPKGSERGKMISPISLWNHSPAIFVFMNRNAVLHLSYTFSWYKGSNVRSDCVVTSAAKCYLESLRWISNLWKVERMQCEQLKPCKQVSFLALAVHAFNQGYSWTDR